MVSLKRQRHFFVSMWCCCYRYFYCTLTWAIVWSLYLPKAMTLTHVITVLAAGYEPTNSPFCPSAESSVSGVRMLFLCLFCSYLVLIKNRYSYLFSLCLIM